MTQISGSFIKEVQASYPNATMSMINTAIQIYARSKGSTSLLNPVKEDILAILDAMNGE